ncbi:aldehyde dehydrogenase family protein, partial [Escherichia coli]|nr:aldehyde dehydrogenase family protein [Escherichia coli]
MTTFDIINPATEEFIRSIDLVDVEATDDAIAKAVVAQKRWAATAPAARAQVLRSFARIVAEHNEELAQIEVANA